MADCCYLCNECPSSFGSLRALEDHLQHAHHAPSATVAVGAAQNLMSSITSSASPTSSVSTDDFGQFAAFSLGQPDHNYNSMASSLSLTPKADFADAPRKPEPADATLARDGYPCRFCSRHFSDRDQLNVHYTHTHRDKPQYVCEVCEQVFAVKRELSTHLRIHSGEQPHGCQQCGKEFGTRQLLKKHNMWHTGERSHVCDHCGKAFFQKGHLTQHLMIHKGGRPHKCKLCEKTFIFKFDLNRHMKIHAERGHSCRKCNKSYGSQAELEEHVCKKLVRSPKREERATPLSELSHTSTPFSSPSTAAQPSPLSQCPPASATSPDLGPSAAHDSVASYQMARLAQLLLAQQQQRLLNAAAQQLIANTAPLNNNNSMNNNASNPQLAKLQLSAMFPTSSSFATNNNSSNQLLASQQMPVLHNQTMSCGLCGMGFETAQAYALHCSLAHANSLLDEPPRLPNLAIQPQSNEMAMESGASSSCASSPQKISPVSSLDSEHHLHHGTSPCAHCMELKSKCFSLEKDLNDANNEVAKFREFFNRLGPYLSLVN